MTINIDFKNYGSFRDSLKAPIHRWFTYPAGYSHKFVEAKIAENRLKPGCWIADPFLGTGTTSIVAKMAGINSLGVEAHPFVYWVARTKMKFDYDLSILYAEVGEVLKKARLTEDSSEILSMDLWPALIFKCFDTDNLRKLHALKSAINNSSIDPLHIDLLKLALTATLRVVTTAGSGWPYIAPSKYAEKTVKRDAYVEFEKQCILMLADLSSVQSFGYPPSEQRIIHGDARRLSEYAPPESIDLIITSPPYLNNYDYADRTRLETYFWGIYNDWGSITHEVRDHLMTAATTQVRFSAMNGVRECPGIRAVAPETHGQLVEIVHQLEKMRGIKPGKEPVP